MTPNEIRDLKEIAAGRVPVGSGPQAVAKAILILLNLANDVRALADEVWAIKTDLDIHVHTAAPVSLLSNSNAANEPLEVKKEETP